MLRPDLDLALQILWRKAEVEQPLVAVARPGLRQIDQFFRFASISSTRKAVNKSAAAAG